MRGCPLRRLVDRLVEIARRRVVVVDFDARARRCHECGGFAARLERFDAHLESRGWIVETEGERKWMGDLALVARRDEQRRVAVLFECARPLFLDVSTLRCHEMCTARLRS